MFTAPTMIEIAPAALAAVEPEPKAGFTRFIRREPLGVVLNLAAWNYPLLTAINTIVPALFAGNVVALKHASQTPKIGARLEEAFSNLPEGVFTNLFLDHETTSALIGERAFDFCLGFLQSCDDPPVGETQFPGFVARPAGLAFTVHQHIT